MSRPVFVPRFFGACGLLLAGCAGGNSRNDTAIPPPHVASVACPLRTPEDWQRFLEVAANDDSWVRTCSDLSNCADAVGAFAHHIQDDVLAVLTTCSSDLADNPPIAACTENLRRFLPAWFNQHSTDSYGFRQDNLTYFAAQVGPEAPAGMIEPPGELLAALSSRNNIEEAARANGWPYLAHDSGLGGVRLFVTTADAEDRFDRWMVVGVDDEGHVPSPTIMSFIAVQKKESSGRKLEKVRLHFRDYVVTDAPGAWSLTLPATMEGKCYACHPSGVRMLIPGRGSTADSAPVKGENGWDQRASAEFGLLRLAGLNERLLSYGPPDWNGTVLPGDHGPPLGCALGCTTCHDGNTRGRLTVLTSEGTLRQKMVDQLSMQSLGPGKNVPDDAAMALLEREQTGLALSPEETAALHRARAAHGADFEALMAERFPALYAWLVETPCE